MVIDSGSKCNDRRCFSGETGMHNLRRQSTLNMTAELRLLDFPAGKVPGTGMDKPQRPGMPDAARQGVGEGPSTSSQPTTAKFKSVPKEASGAFKAPSKAALLNPAAKQGDHPPSRKIASPLPSHASSTKLPGWGLSLHTTSHLQ